VGVEVLPVPDYGRSYLSGLGANIAARGPQVRGPAVNSEMCKNEGEGEMAGCGRISLADSLVVVAYGGRH
jgi:hypothetical protein